MSQTQLTNLSETSRKLALCVSSDELKQAFASRVQRMQKRAKVNGFRPGKVPISVVKQLYGKDLLAEVADSLANNKLNTAIQEHELDPVHIGRVDSLPETPEEEWNFAVTLDVIPPFRLPEPESLDATLLRSEVSDADVEATLERMRQNYPNYVEVSRVARVDDYMRLRFVYQLTENDAPAPELENAEIGNTNFSGSFADERWHISNAMPIPGLCEALVGLSQGEKKTFSLPVGDQYQNAEWRNKTVHFFVEVLAVEEQQLPEVNAAFAERLGIKDAEDPLLELRSRTRKDLANRLQARLDTVNKQHLFDALTAAAEVKLPQSVIDHQNVQLRREMAQRFLSPQELQQDPHPENRFNPELFAEKAKERAKLSEVFKRFVREHKIEADKESLTRVLAKAASEYDDPQAFINEVSKNRDSMNHFRLIAIEETAYHWLLDRCKAVWKDASMDDVFATSDKQQEDTDAPAALPTEPDEGDHANCDHSH